MLFCKICAILSYLNRIKLRLLAVLLLCLSMAIVFSYVFTARNTLVIYDEGAAQAVSYRGDPAQAMEAAGIHLSQEDSYTLNPAGIPQVVINRAKAVTVRFEDGSSITALCDGVTVEDALEEMGLLLGEDDLLDHGLDEPITDGMELQLLRSLVSFQSRLVETDFETHYIENSALPEGRLEPFQDGVPGLSRHTFRRVERGGFLLREELVSVQEIQAPMAALVWKGTGATD